jgi:hypothetical protein
MTPNAPNQEDVDNFADNPVIHQGLGGGRKGVYRPHFVGYLGKGE